jgi:multicomponent K+:H+ antiporter subunit E
VSIDVDQQRWILLVHALDAPDPPALVREIKERYETPLKEMFAC